MKKIRSDYVVVAAGALLLLIIVGLMLPASAGKDESYSLYGGNIDRMPLDVSTPVTLEFAVPVENMKGIGFYYSLSKEHTESGLLEISVLNKTKGTSRNSEELRLNKAVYDYIHDWRQIIIPVEGVQKGDVLAVQIALVEAPKDCDIYLETGERAAQAMQAYLVAGEGREGAPKAVIYHRAKGSVNKLTVLWLIAGALTLVFICFAFLKVRKDSRQDDGEVRKPEAGNFVKKTGNGNGRKTVVTLVFLVGVLTVGLLLAYKMGVRKFADAPEYSFLKVLFVLLGALMVGLTTFVYLCIRANMAFEKLFLVIAIGLGILFELILTPFSVPDEASHIDVAYRLSNRLMGIEETGISSTIFKRTCDIYTDIGERRVIRIERYRWLYEEGLAFGEQEELALSYAASNDSTHEIFYLPAAVGMTFGRLLHLGFLPMIFLARTFNLLSAVGILYWALKRLPFGKSVFGMIALTPVALQEMGSCSYDALIIASSLLFTAYCLCLLYTEKGIRSREVIFFLAAALMLILCKGAVYSPLLLLGGYAIYKRKGSWKRWRREIFLACGIILLSGFLMNATIFLSILNRPAATGAATETVLAVETESEESEGRDIQATGEGELAKEHYTVGMVMRSPGEIFKMAIRTVYQQTDFYISTLFGGYLGHFQISVSMYVQFLYALLFMAAVLRAADGRVALRKDKVAMAGIVVLVVALIFCAYILDYTSVGSPIIEGVQGRYFIPVLGLAAMCIRGDWLVLKRKPYIPMLFCSFLLGIFSVLQIVLQVTL